MKLNSFCGCEHRRASALVAIIVPSLIQVCAMFISRGLSLYLLTQGIKQKLDLFEFNTFLFFITLIILHLAAYGIFSKNPSCLFMCLIFWIVFMTYPIAGLFAIINGSLMSELVSNSVLIVIWMILYDINMLAIWIVYSYYRILHNISISASMRVTYRNYSTNTTDIA